jgi:hypothetical protein
MPSRRWSIELDGAQDPSGLFVDRAGRIVVSTTRRVESDEPGGISNIVVTQVKPPSTKYINDHVHHCYVIDPVGRVDWMANAVNVRCESPDGKLVGINERSDLLLLDRAGHLLEARAVGNPWSIAGWAGDDPIITSTPGAKWVAPHLYSFHERHLHRYDARGQLLEKMPISRELFDTACRQRPELASWPDSLKFPYKLDLEYHQHSGRLIASHWPLLAWTAGLRLDGTVDWVTLTGDGCCNNGCLVGGSVFVHASSCGNQVTFVSPDGSVLQKREVALAGRCFPSDNDSVGVTASNAIHAFDLRGAPLWTLDVPNVRTATAFGGVLYTVSGETKLEVAAFAIR